MFSCHKSWNFVNGVYPLEQEIVFVDFRCQYYLEEEDICQTKTPRNQFHFTFQPDVFVGQLSFVHYSALYVYVFMSLEFVRA